MAWMIAARRLLFSANFGIDKEHYDGRVKHAVNLGAVEESTVENAAGGVYAFHIHVNPFFITHINGELLPTDSPLRRWHDTFGLPFLWDKTPGSVTNRTRFEIFGGRFVIHCHILRHEDLGMMQAVEVISPLSDHVFMAKRNCYW